jgi:lipoic acid synthetase
MRVLQTGKQINPEIYTKSSLMLGLGEHQDEVLECMDDLRAIGVDIITLGQYLQPGIGYAPVIEYISPHTFDIYKRLARHKGFGNVSAGPFVRSSNKAGEIYQRNIVNWKSYGK